MKAVGGRVVLSAHEAPKSSSLKKGPWEKTPNLQMTSEEAPSRGGEGERCLEIVQHFKRYQGSEKASTAKHRDSGPPKEGLGECKVGKVLAGTESKKGSG